MAEPAPRPSGSDAPAPPDLSVVIVLHASDGLRTLRELFDDYRRELAGTGRSTEWVFVIDGELPELAREAAALADHDGAVKIVQLTRSRGDATALAIGLECASGATILTLPSHHIVDPGELPGLVESLGESDMVTVRRWPRRDNWINRVQTLVFHRLIRWLVRVPFRDLTCNLRIMRREVAETIEVYGELHRFLPVLAHQAGFRVREVDLPQAPQDAYSRVFGPAVYLRRLLDLLGLFFLLKYTSKPLRVFGATGLTFFAAGAVFTGVLAFQRLVQGVALANRPVLLLGLLLMVVGIQLFAIGLIGELIIFVNARSLRDYVVEEIVPEPRPGDERPLPRRVRRPIEPKGEPLA